MSEEVRKILYRTTENVIYILLVLGCIVILNHFTSLFEAHPTKFRVDCNGEIYEGIIRESLNVTCPKAEKGNDNE